MVMELLYFDSYFTQMGQVNNKSALAEINGLALKRRQAITQPVMI